MKVIGIVGSPRKNGNTNVLVQQVLEGAAEAGAETRTFFLNEMNYRGCQGCNYCKAHEECKLEDDLVEVFNEIAAADGVVFGSPIYFAQFTGQMRLFLDRCYSLINADFSPRLPAGKKAVIVGVQGAPEPSAFKSVYEEFGGQISGVMAMEIKDTLVGVGYHAPGEVKDNLELMEKAKNTGLNLFK
ncbi:iron-sulfur protein [Methanosarcina sp. 2.H.T.1A.6]|uniref:flavodoxin family protein n=1 Tax=unclassified Methanosarcina TaxID=2644672 RepID=UPI000622404B|nr:MULTISPECIES: flavodoxin family protein [unclassified Methanosarcina]KKG16199.1 iron-sulfur protein [Methanosarcina sp. 2.H.T.1A.3]KKG23081.1 iron-sulfur protein [Methanosarcina sp. 2.H.T.1A.6]KKG26304.1 iron-sulfur protein [Methanosarcina sp. 2.H.T.1A.8]KKG27390.1 iron-sulfur protein [Methanosarcina sp. 2.H.T.1A.15]